MSDATTPFVHRSGATRELPLHPLAEPWLELLPESTTSIASMLGAYSDDESATRAALSSKWLWKQPR